MYQNQLSFDAEVKFYNAPNASAKLWSNYVNMRLKTDPQLGRIIGALNPAKFPDSGHLNLSQCSGDAGQDAPASSNQLVSV